MAQKETSSKSRRWLGLSGAAVLVANLVLTGTTIAFQQEGEVNHALGIEGAGASYGGTEFSADGTLSDERLPARRCFLLRSLLHIGKKQYNILDFIFTRKKQLLF